MKKVICSVRDLTANVFALPFTSHNEGTATRDFAHAVNDPQSALNKSPSEFSLYHIGHFDDDTGLVTAVGPTLLCHASDFVKE